MADPNLARVDDVLDANKLREYLKHLEDEIADLRVEKRGLKGTLKKVLGELDEFRNEKKEFKEWLNQGDRKQKLTEMGQ